MAIINNLYKKVEPYFHREVENDFNKGKLASGQKRSLIHECLRLTCLIPIIGLYQPASYPLALFLGGVRVVTSLWQLIDAAKKKNTQDTVQACVRTAVSVSAFVLTIFLHPVGMLVTTSHDMLIEAYRFVKNIEAKLYKEAGKNFLVILKNALYFALFAHGGVELAIASLVVQITLGLMNSAGEFKKGNYLEGAATLVMSMARTNQLATKAHTISIKSNDARFDTKNSISIKTQPRTQSKIFA